MQIRSACATRASISPLHNTFLRTKSPPPASHHLWVCRRRFAQKMTEKWLKYHRKENLFVFSFPKAVPVANCVLQLNLRIVLFTGTVKGRIAFCPTARRASAPAGRLGRLCRPLRRLRRRALRAVFPVPISVPLALSTEPPLKGVFLCCE